jgi:hypothetical protein
MVVAVQKQNGEQKGLSSKARDEEVCASRSDSSIGRLKIQKQFESEKKMQTQ